MERKREGEGGYFEGGWRRRGKTDLERGREGMILMRVGG